MNKESADNFSQMPPSSVSIANFSEISHLFLHLAWHNKGNKFVRNLVSFHIVLYIYNTAD